MGRLCWCCGHAYMPFNSEARFGSNRSELQMAVEQNVLQQQDLDVAKAALDAANEAMEQLKRKHAMEVAHSKDVKQERTVNKPLEVPETFFLQKPKVEPSADGLVAFFFLHARD